LSPPADTAASSFEVNFDAVDSDSIVPLTAAANITVEVTPAAPAAKPLVPDSAPAPAPAAAPARVVVPTNEPVRLAPKGVQAGLHVALSDSPDTDLRGRPAADVDVVVSTRDAVGRRAGHHAHVPHVRRGRRGRRAALAPPHPAPPLTAPRRSPDHGPPEPVSKNPVRYARTTAWTRSRTPGFGRRWS
jgi:hypothetical protein